MKKTRNYSYLPNMILKKRRMRKMKTECNWSLKKIATNCCSDNYLCLMKKRMKVLNYCSNTNYVEWLNLWNK